MWKPEGFLRVSVSGDAVSGSHAMGLAEDLELLVHSLVQRPDSIAGRPTEVSETSTSDEETRIDVAFHGLQLDPDAEAELHRLVREHVQQRVARRETEK